MINLKQKELSIIKAFNKNIFAKLLRYFKNLMCITLNSLILYNLLIINILKLILIIIILKSELKINNIIFMKKDVTLN